MSLKYYVENPQMLTRRVKKRETPSPVELARRKIIERTTEVKKFETEEPENFNQNREKNSFFCVFLEMLLAFFMKTFQVAFSEIFNSCFS
jgi:hypothetical protein